MRRDSEIPPASRRFARVVRLGACGVTLTATLLLAAPAARADCPILDPSCLADTVVEVVDDTSDVVTDTTDTVVDTVTETTDTVVDTATDTVDTVVETATDTVDTVVEVVEEVVTTVENAVTETTDTGQETVDPVLGGGQPVGSSAGDDARANDQASAGDTLRTDDPMSRSSEGTIADAGAGRPAVGAVVASSSTAAGDVGSPSGLGPITPRPDAASLDAGAPPVDGDPAAVGFANAIHALAFPLALAVVVVAFLLVQGRLDRRDPKLALAPVGPDVIGFS